MKLKSLVSSLAVIGAASFATPALAGYVVLDGWRLDTPLSSTTNIGRLNLVEGSADIVQETDSLGNVFVGSDFTETGKIFSLSYGAENVVGAGDTSDPVNLPTSLKISFSDVAGKVTELISGGGFRYVFTSGTFTITSADLGVSSGLIVGLGGTAATTAIIGGTTGTSTLLASILTSSGLNYYDKFDNLLNPLMATGEFLFQGTTNNTINSTSGVISCDGVDGTYCVNLTASSGGDAYIVKLVPEPATMALLGLGLLGMGFSSRRKGKTV